MITKLSRPTHITNELFIRSPHNPIITHKDMPYLCSTVFNPGATEFEGETLLLLRVEDLEGKSHLTVARSRNGVDGWRIETEPLISPSNGAGPYEVFGCEDPRITYLDDLNKWVIAYTAYSPFGAGVALATTEDFRSVNRFGLVLAPINKDAAVFPRKIKDHYWMLHRPAAGDIEHIWLTVSDDLVHWGRPWCVLMERGGPMWDGSKVGANTVPIETEEGWLILFHGVKVFAGSPTYRVGLALLDLEDPRRLIARLPYWALGPYEPYEVAGAVPNVVFPCGHIQNGDEIRVYYGAADSTVCLATASISEILDALRKYRV
ncbi:MAG TPA: glycosidase [Armatimonadota bacterium]|nr:glycosidase [Armatimonadota bacterium]